MAIGDEATVYCTIDLRPVDVALSDGAPKAVALCCGGETRRVGEASRLTRRPRKVQRDSCYGRSKARRLTYDEPSARTQLRQAGNVAPLPRLNSAFDRFADPIPLAAAL
jgi:hypothetical protein